MNKIYVYITLILFGFWLLFFSYNPYTHVSIHRNWISGKTELKGPGISITPPWTFVSRIDIRPKRVCIECSCQNINCQLVSFNPSGWKDFLKVERFGYYWWRNRLSFNFGHEEEYRGISNVLRGYSFSDKNYTFLKKYKEVN